MHLGSVARLDNADTQFLIWNVAWVARTLILDPLHVFDANIFYPHRGTLAYSEANLGAGVLASPVYWATGNPYAAHNFALLSSFVLSATGSYYLVRYLVGDRRAAAIAGICFAFCPYVFGRIPHIHLLMTAGLPFSMLAFHRLADRPTLGRGAALGLAVAAQALFCGYYAVFVALTVAFAVLVVATTRRRWTDASYWTAVGAAAFVALALALPLFLPYMRLQRATGFARPLDQARHYSADWRAYLASSAYAHRWMLPMIRHWNEGTVSRLRHHHLRRCGSRSGVARRRPTAGGLDPLWWPRRRRFLGVVRSRCWPVQPAVFQCAGLQFAARGSSIWDRRDLRAFDAGRRLDLRPARQVGRCAEDRR